MYEWPTWHRAKRDNQGTKERVLMNWLGHRNSRMVHRYHHLHDEESIRQMQHVKLFFFSGPSSVGQRAFFEGKGENSPEPQRRTS